MDGLDVPPGSRHPRGVQALADRIAEALQRTRPKGNGPALEMWAEIAVAVAAALAALDPAFDFGRFYSEAGGL